MHSPPSRPLGPVGHCIARVITSAIFAGVGGAGFASGALLMAKNCPWEQKRIATHYGSRGQFVKFYAAQGAMCGALYGLLPFGLVVPLAVTGTLILDEVMFPSPSLKNP